MNKEVIKVKYVYNYNTKVLKKVMNVKKGIKK